MPQISDPEEFSLEEIRRRLNSAQGTLFWRGLRELADLKGFREHLERIFPDGGFHAENPDRRRMLKLIAASLALAGFTGCSGQRPEKIVPYVYEPERIAPGHPLFYATSMPLSGYGKGVLVESHAGRPTKVEGNPRHPASLGATDPFSQASVLSLYDSDRSKGVMFQGRPGSWTSLSSELNSRLEEQRQKNGTGLRILTETVTSPTLISQIQRLLTRFPEAKWRQYEPVNTDNAREASRIAFGQDLNTYYRVREADVILTLDSDFLTRGPAWLRYAREWAERRGQSAGARGMNRLYAIESSPTCTGAAADHRIAAKASQIETFGRAVAAVLGIELSEAAGETVDRKLVQTIANDLMQHRGACLVIPGEDQPASVHALAHVMNSYLGNDGRTVIHTDPVEANPAVNHMQSLSELVQEMKLGQVGLLVILCGNPAFTAPADLQFADALRKVAFTLHLGMYDDETAALCRWHVPEAHYLEAWSDIRAFDGTVGVIQPLIAPLYEGRTPHDILALLEGSVEPSSLDIVRAYWQSRNPSADFEQFWTASLQAGVIPGTALPDKPVTAKQIPAPPAGRQASAQQLEIIYKPDPGIYDGRFSNNGWLQELPRPITKITWENAALAGPRTAERLGFNLGQLSEVSAKGLVEPLVEIRCRGRSVQAPLHVIAGHPEDSITVFYGYGRKRGGRVAAGSGFNAYLLRTSNAPFFDAGAEIKRTDRSALLSATQYHFTMAGRNLVRMTTEEELRGNATSVEKGEHAPDSHETLFPAWPFKEYKWAMTVDLSRCIGCNSCVVACEAENNTPVIGKEQVGRQREMHWLRIDRYYHGDPDRPQTSFQPVFCMHCELAPCEYVCPTHATNHSSEGINQMVYNRCVGTRFCSHNCPYKVRRFNFLQYTDYTTPAMEPVYNPDVTVRGRGVMEKCTYCIQRIQEAKIAAARENREVRDGEIVTACQQACPTRVFTFGDLNNRNSAVHRSAASSLNYGLLAELNTRPRTTYLAAVKNPHPEIAKGDKA